MITKFNVGDAVQIKNTDKKGKVSLISIVDKDFVIYEIKLEKSIYNPETAWYDESILTSSRKGDPNERAS